MSLMSLILALIVVVVFLWVINSVIQIPANVRMIINVLIAVVLLFFLLNVLGLFTGLRDIRIGR